MMDDDGGWMDDGGGWRMEDGWMDGWMLMDDG